MKEITLYKRGTAHTLIPLYAEAIHAGFESPAADYEEARIVFYLSGLQEELRTV